MRHFWNWVKNEDATRTLYLEGVIAEESWFADDVTPAMFKEELYSGDGPITLHINSPGGDCFAASQIYTMLMEYSMMMIHNPFTMAMGDSEEMRKAIQLLDEVKESIINAYEIKTGQSRTKLSHLMDSETWMNAWKAKELGFCDEVMFAEGDQPDTKNVSGFSYARKTAAACLMNRLVASVPKAEPEKAPADETRVSTAAAENRLLKTKYL